MAKVRGANRFFETQTFRQGFPPVLEPTTVALLPTPYADGAICPVTDDPENPVYIRKGGAWVPLGGGGGGGGDLATFEPLETNVDYNDPTAVDPTAGLVFTRQAEIDAFLTNEGATAFKHMNALWEALPTILKHNITINVAAGIQRPRPVETYGTWDFANKVQMGDVSVTVRGPAPSTWPAVDPTLIGLTVTSAQVGSGDPWIEFAGTPFTGFDLRGYRAVLSTGQQTVIHEHTVNRLYVLDALSPAPVGETVKVARPSAIITNTVDDVTVLTWQCILGRLNHTGVWFSGLTIENIRVRSLPAPQGMPSLYILSGFFIGTNIEIDAENTPDGSGFGIYTSMTPPYVYLVSCTCLAPTPPADPPDQPISVNYMAYAFMMSCYMRGWSNSISVSQWAGLGMVQCVIDGVGDHMSTGSIAVMQSGMLVMNDYGTGGKINEIRNTYTQTPGIWFMDASFPARSAGWIHNNMFIVRFRNCAAPCIRIGSNCMLDGYSYGGVDVQSLGDNDDVGVEFAGQNSSMDATLLSGGTIAVGGALGDVRMADGEIWSYADIQALGPIQDGVGNVVKKG